MDKLKPCPFCGEAIEIKTDDIFFCKCSDGTLSLACDNCSTTGPTAKSKEAAVKAWNTRTADTELAAANARIAELEAERFTRQELDIIRQWYNAVQDVSPRYLNADDIDDDSVFLKVCALLKEKE